MNENARAHEVQGPRLKVFEYLPHEAHDRLCHLLRGMEHNPAANASSNQDDLLVPVLLLEPLDQRARVGDPAGDGGVLVLS